MSVVKLSALLGLSGSKARKFDYAVAELEQKINHSPTARLMAEIYSFSRQASARFGLDGDDLLWQEAFAAAKNSFSESQGGREFWQKSQARIMIASDGIVSLNPQDLADNLQIKAQNQQNLENFRQALRREIIEKFNEKLPKNSSKNISEKLF